MKIERSLKENFLIEGVLLEKDLEIFLIPNETLGLKVVWLKKGIDEIICYPQKNGCDFIETIGFHTTKEEKLKKRKRFKEENKILDFFSFQIEEIKIKGSNVRFKILLKKEGKTKENFAYFPLLVGELKKMWKIKKGK